jgi:hypothetical protein
MLTLYHAPRSRSFRILWLLEELGVPYDTDSAYAERLAARPAMHRALQRDGDIGES